MKEKIKKGLKKLAKFSKGTWNSVKNHPKEVIMVIGLGAGGYTLHESAPNAYAADAVEIQVNNVSWNGSDYDYISDPVLYLITGDTFFERYVLGEDVDWILGLTNPNLTIHTQEPNDSNKMATSKKPPHNPGWAVYLGVKGSIAGPKSNEIEAIVNDANGLAHRKVIAYDKANSNTIHNIDKTLGVWTFITLPDIVNKQDETYAIWMVATPPNLPGDSAGPNGVGKLDGQNDYFDIDVIHSQWLQTTEEGENYLEGDLNFDRIVNFKDLAIPAGYWWMTEDGNPISKVFTPEHEGPYLAAFQESAIKNFYDDKAKKVKVARLVG